MPFKQWAVVIVNVQGMPTHFKEINGYSIQGKKKSSPPLNSTSLEEEEE